MIAVTCMHRENENDKVTLKNIETAHRNILSPSGSVSFSHTQTRIVHTCNTCVRICTQPSTLVYASSTHEYFFKIYMELSLRGKKKKQHLQWPMKVIKHHTMSILSWQWWLSDLTTPGITLFDMHNSVIFF